ncbi:MAG: 2-oxoacid:acceptor oxidoreductase family protein [Candidatus Hydrothermales bacterium]
MKRSIKEIQFAGFGGQGIVLSSYILGQGITVFEGRNSSMTQSYGPEARGGACSSGVVISDNPDEMVPYPKVTEPDVLVCMSQEAYTTYLRKIKIGGILIYDSDLVTIEDKRDDIEYIPIPATRKAEELGNKLVANSIMLGVLQRITGVCSVEALKKSIEFSVRKEYAELNIKAFDEGIRLAEDFLKKGDKK